MKTNLQDFLFKSYPIFFKHYYDSSKEKIQCPNGWYKLIKSVAETAESYNNKHSTNHHIEAEFIGEKFGLLCIHTNKEIESVNDIITQVYFQSINVCQYCGGSAERILNGLWIKSICTRCLSKGKNKIKKVDII